MRLLTRYILWEILKVFAASLLGLTLLMIVVVIGNVVRRQGLGFEPVIRLLPFAVPFSMRFTVPAAMLYSVCVVYGRMAGDQEVIAIKAGGISPIAVLRPALILALFVSPVAIWINDVGVSWGMPGMNRVVLESVEQIAYGLLRTKGAYASEKFSIRVARVDGRKLIEPIISVRMDDSPPTTITADQAQLNVNEDGSMLEITLIQCEIEVGNKPPIRISEHTHPIPLTIASKQGELSSRPADLPWGRIPTELAEQESRVQEIEARLAAQAAFQMIAGDVDGLAEAGWIKRRRDLQMAKNLVHKLRTERWRRTAVGFSCFFFVLVGAPVAIYLRSADFLSTFFICFMPILLGYYPLLMLGVDRAKVGAAPPYLVWLGNLVFAFVGIWLIRRVLEDRPSPGLGLFGRVTRILSIFTFPFRVFTPATAAR